MAKFPRAGAGSEPKANDPMMKRVDMDHGEMTSRPAAMPKSYDNGQMSLSHVGGADKQSG